MTDRERELEYKVAELEAKIVELEAVLKQAEDKLFDVVFNTPALYKDAILKGAAQALEEEFR